MTKTLAVTPRMSEKAYSISQNGVFIFDVPASANKHTIARAVSEQFNVTVASVNITNMNGKAKRTIAKKGRIVKRGMTSDFKKAYVTLKKGDTLPFFTALEEEAEKQQQTQEKLTKAMEKQSAKETKQSSRRGLHLPTRRSGSRGGDK